MKRGYGEDLAFIHEAGFTALARAAAGLLVPRLRAAGFRDGLVVDVGCGGGALAKSLVEAGYRVHGLDASAPMIRLARAHEPRATFEVASFRRASLPPCVAITAVGEVLSYLIDPRVGGSALGAFFARARAALAPGGLLLFDVVEATRRPENRDAFAEDERAGWAVGMHVREAAGSGVVRREITTFRRIGRTYRRSVEVHRQRRYPRAPVLRMLRRAGFAARTLDGYGAVSFRAGQTGFFARKR